GMAHRFDGPQQPPRCSNAIPGGARTVFVEPGAQGSAGRRRGGGEPRLPGMNMNPASHHSESIGARPGGFPTVRPRRLRHYPLIRCLVRETTLTVQDLILPLFVRPGHGIKKEIASMPGNYQLSIDRLIEEVGVSLDLGVRAFILFGIPTHKDAT